MRNSLTRRLSQTASSLFNGSDSYGLVDPLQNESLGFASKNDRKVTSLLISSYFSSSQILI
jgi:hypothetical protein